MQLRVSHPAWCRRVRAKSAVALEQIRFRGEPAVRLRAGETLFTVLPERGLTGVSLRHAGGEYLALPGGLDRLGAGRTSGLPLMAPWANRLSSSTYRVGRVSVDVGPSLADGSVCTDANGLPMHGFLAGRSRWSMLGSGVRAGSGPGSRAGSAWLRCAFDVDGPALPFPHRVEVSFRLREAALTVDTRVVATGRRRVPVAFGWHPYLRVPGTRRDELRLRVPALRHHLLDARNLPTGEVVDEARADGVVGRRRFDDLYEFRGRGRAMALIGADDRSVTVRAGVGYQFAQIWVPAGRPYASLEPMVAPTDALTVGTAPMLGPGEAYDARFVIELA